MHDIARSRTDYILNKPAKLTPEEHEQMKMHTVNGAIIVDRMDLPGQAELKACIRDVALHHHERFDGTGYPDHLAGDDIAIGVQVVSLADVYDALVSERCYKEGFEQDLAVNMILDGECGVFNPLLLESFKACVPSYRKIYEADRPKTANGGPVNV
jgi:putative two-component system response regulator